MGKKKKANAKQIPLFEEMCVHHGPAECCTACPGKLSADSLGFVHPRDAAGRTPMRQCNGCGLFRRREAWSVTDWYKCKECATIVARAAAAHARMFKTGEPKFDGVQEKAALAWERKAEEKTDYTGREIK